MYEQFCDVRGSSYQIDLYGLFPVLFIVDAGVVDNDVQTTKLVYRPVKCIYSTKTKSNQWMTWDIDGNVLND